MPKTDLDHADYIMHLPHGAWIMAMAPVTVTDMRNGGTITLPMGARVRLSCTLATSAFGYTENAAHVSFGMAEAADFMPVPNRISKERPNI